MKILQFLISWLSPKPTPAPTLPPAPPEEDEPTKGHPLYLMTPIDFNEYCALRACGYDPQYVEQLSLLPGEDDLSADAAFAWEMQQLFGDDELGEEAITPSPDQLPLFG